MDYKPRYIFIGSCYFESQGVEVGNMCATFDEQLAIEMAFDYISEDPELISDNGRFTSPLTETEIQNVRTITDFNGLIRSKKNPRWGDEPLTCEIMCVKIDY